MQKKEPEKKETSQERDKKQGKPLFKNPTNPFAKRPTSANPAAAIQEPPKVNQVAANQKTFTLGKDDDYEDDFDQSTSNK